MSTAMMAITARSSTSVNPPRRNDDLMSSTKAPRPVTIHRSCTSRRESMTKIRPLLTEIPPFPPASRRRPTWLDGSA